MDLGQLIYAAIALVFGLLGWGASKKFRGTTAQGRQEAEQEAKNADNENAADIRRRARDADGLPDDGGGYRD